jgi:NTE family protein
MKPCSYKIFSILFLLLIMFAPQDIYTQKVAVVLSGGGSRGAAHVGVLRALEENNIPVDYITGTSIGAFVGAMYATGYSPDEIEAFLTSEAMRRWSSGKFGAEYNYFYRQGEPDGSWIKVDFDFSKRISKIIPTSLVSSVEMDFNITELFSSASVVAEHDFDRLFIPFRCVAADVDSSKAVVLSSGDLGRAVRASLSFPFVFNPIKIDGRLLFDGGMYNNFPHDIAAQEFKPDLIIGSKVSHNYPTPDPDDLVSQIQKMLMTDTDFDLSVDHGIIIEPKLLRPGLTDFTQARTMIKSGYDETIRQMPAIKAMISDFRESADVEQARVAFRKHLLPYTIDSMLAPGLDKNETEYVRRMLFGKSDTTTLSKIEKGYYRIAADGYLNVGMPQLNLDQDSKNYCLKLEMSRADQFSLKFGGNLSTRIANLGYVEMNYKYLFTHGLNLKANVYFGRFYTSVLLGVNLEYPSQIPFYLGGRLVYNHFDYFKSTIHFFEDITPSYLIQDDNYLRIFGGMPTSPKAKLEAGFSVGLTRDQYYQSNIFTREDTADLTRFKFTQASIRWERSTLNRKQYATSGARFLLHAGIIGGSERFRSGSLATAEFQDEDTDHQWLRLKLVWDNYFKKIGPVRFGFYGELHFSNQELFKNHTSSLLTAPAFAEIPESKTIFLPNFRAYNYGVAGLKTVFQIAKNFDVRFENYIFQPYRQIRQNDNHTTYFGEKFSDRYWMSSGALVYNTFLGPVSFSVNYFENPEDKFFFALNIGYLIFNKRALE